MPTPVPGKGKGKAQQRDANSHRRSRSRNSTPVSASSVSAILDTPHSPYLQTSLNQYNNLSNSPVDDIFDGSSSSSNPPSASTLRTITESVKTQLLNTIKPRGDICDRLMRELSSKRKERTERTRLRELAEREAEERKKLLSVTPKKRGREEERPLAVGAHGLARQDGVDVHTGELRPSLCVTKGKAWHLSLLHIQDIHHFDTKQYLHDIEHFN
jgi:transcriptional adapter 3